QLSALSQEGSLTALAFSPDGRFLASAAGGTEHGVPRTLRIWDWQTREIVLDRRAPANVEIRRVAYSPDGQSLALGAGDGFLELVDFATGENKINIRAHPGPVEDLAFSPDGTTLASGGPGPIRLWDVATGREFISIPRNSGNWCKCIRF